MKTWFDELGYPLYCDAGPHEGDTRVDRRSGCTCRRRSTPGTRGPESLRITLGEPREAGGTAETSTGRPAWRRGRSARPVPGPAEPASAYTAKEHTDGCP